LSDGFIHGYGIAGRIRNLTDGVLDVERAGHRAPSGQVV
jgi:hypothetical protein